MIRFQVGDQLHQSLAQATGPQAQPGLVVKVRVPGDLGVRDREIVNHRLDTLQLAARIVQQCLACGPLGKELADLNAGAGRDRDWLHLQALPLIIVGGSIAVSCQGRAALNTKLGDLGQAV